MSETATQQAPVIEHQEIDVDQQQEEIDVDQPQQEIDVDQQQTDAVAVETFENDFVFDCPELFDFKDPNDDDLGDLNQENVVRRNRPQLVRNQTRTKLYKPVDKQMTLSPISKKKKQFKPITYNNRRPITNVNERLYNAALRRPPSYKTLAELVQDFDKKTRFYEDENLNKYRDQRKNLMHPKSPKLLSKNRNRARTALSQLEQDELIARTIKKNTFRARPINKKIFDNYATGIPKVQCPKKSAIKNLDFGFHSTRRLEMRKEKMQAIQQSIENVNVNFVFKARPMPVFKKVPIMMRNNQMAKKQTSDTCLNQNLKKMTNTIVKQTSDSTLTRIAHNDLMSDCSSETKEEETKTESNDDHPNNVLTSKAINENLFIETEDECSICEFKSLTNFESSKEYADGIQAACLNNNDKENNEN